MKRSSEKTQNTTTAPSRLRSAIMVLLGITLGSAAGYHMKARDAELERQKMETVLAEKDKSLKGCHKNSRDADIQLRRTKQQLAQVTAAKEQLNDWQVFLRGLREKSPEQLVSEDDLAGQCRELDDQDAEARAIKALDFFGITNEADRQAVIDSYKQGCFINSLTKEGGLNMQLRNKTYCSVELEESLHKEYINPDEYEKGSNSEKTAMERLRDKDYQGALDAYESVLNELEALADSDPVISGLPFYDDFKKHFRDVYDAFRRGDSLEGICKIGVAAKIWGDLEENEALNALADSENGNLEALRRKFGLFGDIIQAIGDKDHPEFSESGFSSPELIEACQKIGMDVSQ